MAIYRRMKVPKGCPDWISCLRSGEELALKHFYNEWHRGVYLFCLGIVLREEDAEDMVAESFMKLWEARASINDETHLRNSLYRYARQLSLNCLRARKREQRLEQQLANRSSVEEQRILQQDKNAAVDAREAEKFRARVLELLFHSIESLPPGCREVLRLSLEGKSTHEIAEQLQIATQTVLNQKTRARNKLKEVFQHKEGYSLLLFLLPFLDS